MFCQVDVECSSATNLRGADDLNHENRGGTRVYGFIENRGDPVQLLTRRRGLAAVPGGHFAVPSGAFRRLVSARVPVGTRGLAEAHSASNVPLCSGRILFQP